MLVRIAQMLGICCVVAATACRSAEPLLPNAALQVVVDTKTPAPDHFNRTVWRDIQRFYADNGYQLVWSDGWRPQAPMKALLRAIRSADDEGLDPSRYDVDGLAALYANFDSTRAAEVDVRFTAAYLAYATDLSRGRTRPEKINKAWTSARAPVDVVALLGTAIARDRIDESLKALSPAAPAYRDLRTQLARHRAVAARGQPDHGGSDRTLAERIRLIQINMDRWRWMPDYLGDEYILVNIPAFRLEVFEGGNLVLDMKVVTGRKEDPTPLLADQMTHIVFSPYWNIPTTIVQEEIVPRLVRDPDYLARNNIESMSDGDGPSGLRLRQRPGPGNSLGLVKFMFPNNFNVYLHDTPADKLFDRAERDFSHGCVRLERPADLAKYVLRDRPEWTEARIARAMDGRTEQTVRLQRPLPVYFAYFTAWDEHGTLQTRPDVYGHDQTHLK